MNRSEVLTETIRRIKDIHGMPVERLEEARASVSHWLQSPKMAYPMLDETIRNVVLDVLASQKGNTPTLPGLAESVEKYQTSLLFDDVPFPPPPRWNFTFIDLFAGIGGFRIAFQKAGGKCVFSSEWDRWAKLTYEANFGECPYGDIRRVLKEEIPSHDVLCAGFPCQPFSLAGVSKKNSLGRVHGFADKTQGTLFFEIKEILRIKRPRAFMLENVRNLLSHDCGRTFEVIRSSLEDDLGYVVNWKVIDGAKWVPQHRERIFIVGYDPAQVDILKDDILIPSVPPAGYTYPELASIIEPAVEGQTLGPGTWATLERHLEHHKNAGHGFGYGLHRLPIKPGEVTRTISARYHKDGAEILIEQPGSRPRSLTVREAMQLQGFPPDKFVFPVSKTQAYKQIGNSVVVPAIAECASQIAMVLKKRLK